MPKQQSPSFWIIILPIAAVFIWSLNTVIMRYVTDYISPMSISFYRWFIALCILSPLMLIPLYKQWHQVRPYLTKLIVLSFFGMVAFQGLAYTAAHDTTATNMGIINAFAPIFTLFIAFFLLKTTPKWIAIFGSVLSLCGLLIIIAQGHLQHLVDIGRHRGDLLMILAIIAYATYGVLLKKWALPIPILLSLYLQIAFAVILHIPIVLLTGLDALNSGSLPSVMYAAIFPSIFAPLLWMLTVKRLDPNRTVIFMNLMPVFTSIIAYLWLAESWTIYHSMGGTLVIIGIFLAQRTEKSPHLKQLKPIKHSGFIK